jgi:hypothetical protein
MSYTVNAAARIAARTPPMVYRTGMIWQPAFCHEGDDKNRQCL